MKTAIPLVLCLLLMPIPIAGQSSLLIDDSAAESIVVSHAEIFSSNSRMMLAGPNDITLWQQNQQNSEKNETKNMAQHATGTFEVKLTPQDDKLGGGSIGRMTINKQWQGEVAGTSEGQMLTGGDVKTGSAGYVAMEKFTGTVKGRKGTFLLQHSAIMIEGKGDLTIIVVPNSGTEELKGLAGKLTIKIENGKHFYDLEYSIP